MVYLSSFHFLSDHEETDFLFPPKRNDEFGVPVPQYKVQEQMTLLSTAASSYPFDIFPLKKMDTLEFKTPVTILHGTNGSGKTTALNIIAEKLHLSRDSLFNKSTLMDSYVSLCSYSSDEIPRNSRMISSDDVFNYMLKLRAINQQVGFVKKHVAGNIQERSNGESALMYFEEKIEENALYLLDEPENSLSPEKQLQLVEYINASTVACGCQFIIATHSPFLLSMKYAKVYDLDETPVCIKKWTELKNVRQYRDFFKSHEQEF